MPMPPFPQQASLSYFPLFSWLAHPNALSLTPGHTKHSSVASGTGGNWAFFVVTYILQHFVTVLIAYCGKAQIFDCMNVGVFVNPVSSLLKQVIHFHDSVV